MPLAKELPETRVTAAPRPMFLINFPRFILLFYNKQPIYIIVHFHAETITLIYDI